jgi:hypothetical protein
MKVPIVCEFGNPCTFGVRQFVGEVNLCCRAQTKRAPFERVSFELSGSIPGGDVLLPTCDLHRPHGALKVRKTCLIDDNPFFIEEKML